MAKYRYKFSGISRRTNKEVIGDLIQDEQNDKYYIANKWIIDQNYITHEFECFDCDELAEVDPETITFVRDKI